jgi:parvulin-like peptidyl-prolyl isomerase
MPSTQSSASPNRCRYALLFILILPAVLLSGCGKPSIGTETPSGTLDAAVVATVNNVPISRDDMYTEMEQYVPSQLQDFPRNPFLGVTAGRFALQHLITDELAIQLAKSQQVPATPQQIDDRYNDIKMVQNVHQTRDFDEVLTDQGLTVQQYKTESVEPDVAQFNVLVKGVSATDQELLASYQSNLPDYTEQSRIHIERIVLDDEASADQAYQTASKTNSLDDVLSLNRATPLSGGADDADIAQWIPLEHSDPVLAPIISAASTAQAGTVLKPIKLAGKWWLVKLVDRKAKDVIPFQEVRHIVMWNVLMNKARAAGNIEKVQSAMKDLTEQAVINVRAPQYASLVKQLKDPASDAMAQASATSASN